MLRWCIECDGWVEIDKMYPHVHYTPVGAFGWEKCGGVTTVSSPPPSLTDEDWEFVFANEPSADEAPLYYNIR